MVKPDARDLLAIAGLSATCIGAWMIYPPIAFLVFGLTFMALAFFSED